MDLAASLLATANNGTRAPPTLTGRCAVVGNSGSLLNDRRGELIDGHDEVIRFNAAPSGGTWSEDVGSKSTLRILSSWVAKMRTWHPNDTRATGHSTLLFCMANWVGACVRRGVHPPLAQQSRRWLINPAFVRRVREALLRSSRPPSKQTVLPSAGLLGVAIALRTCARVTLFGFGNPLRDAAASASGSTCEHYYECGGGGGQLASEGRYFSGAHHSNPGLRNHDWAAQWALLTDWVAAGRGRLRLVEPRAASSASGLQDASRSIEERWRRQFSGSRKPVQRSRLGAHFPPPV